MEIKEVRDRPWGNSTSKDSLLFLLLLHKKCYYWQNNKEVIQRLGMIFFVLIFSNNVTYFIFIQKKVN